MSHLDAATFVLAASRAHGESPEDGIVLPEPVVLTIDLDHVRCAFPGAMP